jgi:hypothetical protein
VHTAAGSEGPKRKRPQAQDFFYSKSDAKDPRSRKERKVEKEKEAHLDALQTEIANKIANDDLDYGPLPWAPPSVWKCQETSMMLRLGMKEERLVRDKQNRITRMLEASEETHIAEPSEEGYVAHWQKVGAEARAYVHSLEKNDDV